MKRYGKLSFVDLAGSERLKESKSQGGMIKETGNINKSLFTLGKVIKSLSDKKNKNVNLNIRFLYNFFKFIPTFKALYSLQRFKINNVIDG